MYNKRFLIISILLCFILLMGCSTPSETSNDTDTTDVTEQVRLILSTGSVGGTWHPYGSAIARVVSDNSGIRISTESSAGSVENVRLVGNKVTDLSFAAPNILYEAWSGQGAFEGEQLSEVRSLIGLQTTILFNTAREGSGINSFSDLDNARIALPGAGSGSDIIAQRVFELYGIDSPRIDYMSAAEVYMALGDGRADFVSNLAGFPNPTVEEFTASHNATFINVDENIIDELNADQPFFAKYTIPANTYRGQSQPITTLANRVMLVCHSDMTDEVAYELVKTMLETREDLVNLTALGEQLTEEEALLGISAPLHPGALRYYEEINHPGLELVNEDFK